MVCSRSQKAKNYWLYCTRAVLTYWCYRRGIGASPVFFSCSNLPTDPANLSSDSDVKKEEKKAIKMNNLVIASFTMAFTMGTLMEHMEKTKTNEYSGGVAHAIMDRLKRKFRPADRISGVEAEKELMKPKMDAKKDPDEYFDKLATLYKSKY